MRDAVDILVAHRAAFLAGLRVTGAIAVAVWTLGILGGTGLGLLGSRYNRGVGRATRVTAFALSGVPVLVLLFWMHYPLQAMLRIVVRPVYTVILVLGFINIIGVADVVRGAVRAFPKQYVAAGRVSGMTAAQILRRIQFPIIVRTALPPLVLLQVSMLHMTLFGSLISVDEVFRVAQRLNAQIYMPIPIYSALAAFFILVSLPLNGLAEMLKARFGRDLSER